MDDDRLIHDFFAANTAEIDDRGFSDRVMRRIPKVRPLWISIVHGVLVVALAAWAFVQFDGWALLCSRAVIVAEHLASIPYTGINPLAWIALLVVTVWLTADRIKSMA